MIFGGKLRDIKGIRLISYKIFKRFHIASIDPLKIIPINRLIRKAIDVRTLIEFPVD